MPEHALDPGGACADAPDAVRDRLQRMLHGVAATLPRYERVGVVHEAVGTVLKARGLQAQVGELCQLRDPRRGVELLAEVVGFADGSAILMPHGELDGLSPDTEVHPTGRRHQVAVGDAMLGRVVDGFGQPLDGRPLEVPDLRDSHAAPPRPLSRAPIVQPLVTGVRAIDALVPVGRGQRIGIFAPAGVGKSVLLGMLSRHTQCDVRVIALVGERGREVGEFLEHALGEQGRAQSVVVAATSDTSPMERVCAGYTAAAVAEHFCAQGRQVLMLFDSVTRFARAQREVGLAAGEPPARQGFPPSVFSSLPRLMERAGRWGTGSITGFYTVLVEGEVATDPVGEEVRSILDGHLVLSPKLAHKGHYPAIDVLQSLSRLAPRVSTPPQQAAARRLRALLAKYDEIELLVQLGEYKARSDAEGDEALARIAGIRRFLAQGEGEAARIEDTLQALQRAVGHGG